jgi:hypothetical protein
VSKVSSFTGQRVKVLIVKSLNTNKTISWLKSSKSKLEKDDFVGIGREDRSKSLAWVKQCVASTVGQGDR